MANKLKRYLNGNELDLSMNNLEKVPVADILQIKNVESLDLSNNNITFLNNNFIQLKNILKLDLSKNYLRELPADFGDLEYLQFLDLRGNQLTHLPPSFCHLQRLKWLDLKDNPLKEPLASAAGNCLNEKECKACARQVLQHMKKIEDKIQLRMQERFKLEREEEMRLKREEVTEKTRMKEERKKLRQQRYEEDTLKRRLIHKIEGVNEPALSQQEVVSKINGASSRKVLVCLVFCLFVACLFVCLTCWNSDIALCVQIRRLLPDRLKNSIGRAFGFVDYVVK